MLQTGVINRLIRAAEEWTRRKYHTDAIAIELSEPEACVDGRIKTVVKVDRRTATGQSRRTVCIAILEPDGSISCLQADTIEEQVAQQRAKIACATLFNEQTERFSANGSTPPESR